MVDARAVGQRPNSLAYDGDSLQLLSISKAPYSISLRNYLTVLSLR